jgi:hypothetical protein
MRTILRLIVFIALAAACCASVAAEAGAQEKCTGVKYSKPKAGSVRYVLERVEGQAVLALVSERWDAHAVGGLCLALFNERNRKLLAQASTDEKGQFEFASVSPGKYTLIAFVKEDALHRLVVPLSLYERGGRNSRKPQRLLLRMRLKEDSRASFVTAVSNPALRLELLKMYERDQAIRNEQIARGADRADEALLKRMDEIDSKNTARMRAIIRRYGWPAPELVGIDGADAAFVIVQHAAHDFQKEMLPLVETAYRKNQLPGQNYALLLDRVLVGEGQPQMYGTQARRFNEWKGHEPLLYPIKDAANVDRRRAEVGLGPLAEYLQLLKRMYFPNDKDE